MNSDEVALALSVLDRGWSALLFQPLSYDQVAPLGFLVLERISIAIGGDNEAAFRFFPYLASLVAPILGLGRTRELSRAAWDVGEARELNGLLALTRP